MTLEKINMSKPKKKQPLSSEEFVKQGGVCPVCGSGNTQSEALHTDITSAAEEVRCLDCNSTWFSEFKLTGYSNLTVGKP
jgi:formate dehydrogenase maturation protein FdhE